MGRDDARFASTTPENEKRRVACKLLAPAKIKKEITADDLGADFAEERNWCSTVKRGSGGMDTVIVDVDAAALSHLSLVAPSADERLSSGREFVSRLVLAQPMP